METKVGYIFIGLELKQFAVFEDGYKEDDKDLEISCKFTFAYNFVNNLVCCTNSVSISKDEYPLIKAELDAYFAISPSSVSVLMNDGHITLSEGLQAQFASLTYGTLRGVIFTKTLNTSLNQIILPPNDVLSVFNHPITFELEQ